MNREEIKGLLAQMKEFFDRSTRLLAETDSSFTPAPGMFTAAQQVAHTAQTFDWFVEGAFSKSGFDMDHQRMHVEACAVTSLSAARAWLEKACAAASAAADTHSDSEWNAPLPDGPVMGGLPRHAIFGALMDHTAHHRGALTVYTRLLGRIPPMPYVEM